MAWDTGITSDYLEGLGKQMFIKETILNGMFPCQSDIVKLLRNRKQQWDYHEFYEYRMFLAATNSGGGLNSQLFTPDGALVNPGEVDIGIFRATYGTVSDGFNIDMIANIETRSARAAFLTDYARYLHSMRMNVASIFKNVAINGRFGVMHQLTADDATKANASGSAGKPSPGVEFELKVPSNVYTTGFGPGRLLIKTASGSAPWDPANVTEMYAVVTNEPKRLVLYPLLGSSPTTWTAGQFLELAGNRTIVAGGTIPKVTRGIDSATGKTTYTLSAGSGAYTSGTTAGTGFMEGLADLFPWYSDANGNRLGLNLPFRGQKDRLTFTPQQAGLYYYQDVAHNESILDAIMAGVRLSTLAVPYEDVGVWYNHDTLLAAGAQEAADVTIFKQISLSQPIVYQRGVTATTYTIGNKVIPDMVRDDTLRTDVVIIGPKNDLSYCTLDNSFMKIDEFVQKTFSKEAPPDPQNIHVPDELTTAMNISKRFIVGKPTVGDSTRNTDGYFVHPGNTVPVLYHEMGSLFTPNPYAYVIVKLANQIVDPFDA